MKQNPVRTLVTIVGIMISAAMFTAVTTFAMSLMGFAYRTVLYESGNWHLGKQQVSMEELEAWEQDERIEQLGVGVGLGYAFAGTSNTYKPYVYIESGSEEFFELMPIHLTAGRLPENADEILVPDHLYNNGNVLYHLGDVISFDVGKRCLLNEDGQPDTEYILKQNNKFTADENDNPLETLLTERKRTYTVVGFYERPAFELYSAPGYTLLTRLESEPYGEDAMTVDLYAALRQKFVRSAWNIYNEYDCTEANTDVLNILGAVRYSNVARLFLWIAVVFVLIIVVGSVSMIYSAFSISVSERTKQFGLLSSIGATRRQIRKSVFVEAAIVSAVGIPIGVLCGISGIGITLHFVGNKFSYILSSPYSVDLVVNGWAIMIAVVIAVFTVMISAVIPSKRAVHVSAIDAIRQQNDVKVGGNLFHRNRKYRLTYKIFGMPGMLARRYFSRSRKKYRVTVFSLCMSVVLFIVTSTYCAYLKEFIGTSVNVLNYDLEYGGFDDGNVEELTRLLGEAQGVKELSYMKYDILEMAYEQDEISQSFLDFAAMAGYADSENGILPDTRICVLFLGDADYAEYVKELGISQKLYEDYGNAPGILCNTASSVIYSRDGASYKRYTVEYELFKEGVEQIFAAERGYRDWLYESMQNESTQNETAQTTEADDSEEERKDKEDWIVAQYPVGYLADCAPEIIRDHYYNTLVLTFPYSSKYNTDRSGTMICFRHEPKKHDIMIASLKEKLQEAGYPFGDSFFYDIYASQKQEENMLVIINVFSYGFIVLMALICVANVFNTISTNIGLRRRDFAMLRSVGLSQRGIRRMMIYECILYGIRALLFGLPVSAAFSYLLYNIYGGAGEFAFYIPWTSVLIAGTGVFIVVGVSMFYAVSKIRKDNLIDELKEENA